MKRIITISLIAISLLFSLLKNSNISAQWAKTNGPYGGTINCFAIMGSNTFAGTSGSGIFISTNNGSVWTQVNNGLTDLSVNALLISGTNVFAGTANGGVFISTNTGQSWTAVNNGLTTLTVNELLVSGSMIYAGTEGGGVFRSNDNGATWNAYNINLTSLFITGLAVIGSNLFAGTYDSGVFLSTNSGFSWAAVNSGLTDPNMLSLAVSGTNLIAGSQTGTFITTNNGTSWTQIINGLTSTYVRALTVNGSNIFAGTQGGIFKSTNNGGLWTAVNSGITNLQIYSLISSGSNVFTGTGGDGVFLTTNNGTLWSEVNNGLNAITINTYLFSGTNLYAGTYGSGIFSTTDFGANWVRRNTGLTNKVVMALQYSGANFFAGTYGGGVFISSDNGANWVAVNTGLNNRSVYSLALSGSYLVAGTFGGGVFRTSNNGTSWAAANSGLTSLQVYSVKSNGSLLFAATNGTGGVYKSTNYGTNWTIVNGGLTNKNVRTLMINGTDLFAGTGGGVFKSTNDGTNWTAINNGLTNLNVLSLTSYSGYIYAGTSSGGVFISSDNGANWSQFNDGFGSISPIYSLYSLNDYIYSGPFGKSAWRFDMAAVPDTPVLLNPVNNSIENSPSLTFSWNKSETSSLYNFVLARDSMFTNIVLDTNLTDTLKSVSGLSENKDYYWKVRGKNTMRWGAYSAVSKFRTYSLWTKLSYGMGDFQDVYSMAIYQNYIFAGTLNDGIYLSTDFGGYWFSADNGVSTTNIRSMTAYNGNIFAGTTNAGIFKSTNYGINWAASNSGLTGVNVTALHYSNNKLYAGTWGNGVFVSSDDGANWSAINNGLTNLTVYSLTSNGTNLFAGTFNGGAFLSTNYGANWTAVNNGLTNLVVWCMTLSGGNVYAGTQGGGVFKSSNNGTNWISVNTGLSNLNITSLSNAENYLFAGTGNGFYISTNSGGNWISGSQGLEASTAIYSLLLTDNLIFAGTSGKSMWRREFSFIDLIPPNLLLPPNNSTGNLSDLSIIWSKPRNATNYNIVISTDSLFSSIVINDSLLTDSVKTVTGLSPLTKYFWKVRAKYSSRWSEFSSYYSFKTQGAPTQVSLFYPTNYSTEQITNPVLNWSKATTQTILKNPVAKTKNIETRGDQIEALPLTISNYWLEYSIDSLFTSNVNRDSTLTDTTTTLFSLYPNTKYYWRVKAKNESGWGAFSSAWSFKTTYTTDSINPGYNKLNIPLTSEIKAYFHQNVNSATLDSNSVTLIGSFTGKKRASITFNPVNNSAQLIPSSNFKYGEIITTVLDSGIKTTSGSSIPPFLWNFTSSSSTSDFILNQSSTSSTQGISYPYRIATGDFDGDGDLDMVVIHDGSNGYVNLFRNNGFGSFSSYNTLTLGGNIYGMTTGDVDNDGDIDLIYTNNYTKSVGIYTNNGSGYFYFYSSLSLGINPYGVDAGDMDGDGDLDLAVALIGGNSVAILKNNGNGVFSLFSSLDVGGSPYKIRIGDYDNNGILDVAVTIYSSTVSVLKNNGAGVLSLWSSVSAGNESGELASADFDGDSDIDLAVTNNPGGTLKVLKNNGSGVFAVTSTLSISHSVGIGVSDLDGDGDIDLSVCNSWSNIVSTYRNNGSGTFSFVSNVTTGTYPYAITSGDFDNNGTMDLAVANNNSSNKYISLISNLTPPQFISPSNNSNGNNLSINFNWKVSLGAANYRFQLSIDSLFGSYVVNDSTLIGSDVTKSVSGLSPLTWYYWRMKSKSANGTTSWSSTWRFKTLGSPLQVNLVSPLNNTLNQPVNTVFKWNKTIDQSLVKSRKEKSENTSKTGDYPLSVSNYWFEISSDSLFESVIIVDSSLVDTLKTITGLSNNTSYYWRVKAKNQAGWNTYSAIYKFTTIKNPDLTEFAYPETGNDTTNFGNINLMLIANVTLSKYVSILYFTVGPVTGGMPDGINSVSNYFWSISDSGLIFTDGYLRIPLSFLGGVADPSKLRWLKRSLSGDNWIDLGGIIQNGYLVSTMPFNSFSEFAIGSQDVQPLASTNIKLTLIPEGFYDATNNRLNTKDTFKVYLRDINSPYSFVDSAITVIDSINFSMFLEFQNALSGSYYIVVRHRNSLETWSKSGGIIFTKYTSMTYDFSVSQNNAYGNNQILKGSKWCLYSGDVNQDRTIDLNDIIPILSDYDNLDYHLGNDINKDGTIDLNDAVFVLYGYDNLVGVIMPSKSLQMNNKRINKGKENNNMRDVMEKLRRNDNDIKQSKNDIKNKE